MIRPVTLAIVLVAGMAGALVVAIGDRGERREQDLLTGLTSDDGSLRRSTWASLSPDASAARRAGIMARLEDPGLPRAVIADAARGCLELDWPIVPAHATAAGEFGDAEAFLAWFGPAVRESPAAIDAGAPAIRTILGSDERSGDELMAAVVAAVGSPPSRAPVDRLADAVDRGERSPTTRVQLVLGRLGAPPPIDEPLDSITATRQLLAAPETADGRVLETAPIWATANAGEAARSWLKRRAEAGDADARRAVGLGDPARVTRAERAVLADPDFGYERRTIAAFRLLDAGAAPGDASILNLLDDGPADSDGTVHAAALLGWRGLSPTARDRLMRRWFESTDEDRRRAGIVLAAIAHRLGDDALIPAMVATIDRMVIDETSSAGLRRTARLATRVLGRWRHGDVEPAAYAARTTRLPGGRLDPDSVLLGVLAGDEEASRRLTTSPRPAPLPDPERAAAFARDLAWRRAILSSVAGQRLLRVGEPIPGDETDLRLWIDALAAERIVSGPFLSTTTPIAESAPTEETLRP